MTDGLTLEVLADIESAIASGDFLEVMDYHKHHAPALIAAARDIDSIRGAGSTLGAKMLIVMQANTELQAEVAELKGLLKEAEWISEQADFGTCPICMEYNDGRGRNGGHAQNCRLAEALK